MLSRTRLRRAASLAASSALRGQRYRDVVIAGAARTPIGAFCGSLAPFPATHLASVAIGAALQRAGVDPSEVEAVILGQALPAGCGLNAAKQAALLAKIPPRVDCMGVNKACASGLKAIALAAQAVAVGHADVVVAGGMESMSQAPYILRQARFGGYHYGHAQMEDLALHDGLWEGQLDCHLGSCAEQTALEMGITREDMDRYAIESYRRAADAWQRGAMDIEVAPMRLKPAIVDRQGRTPRNDGQKQVVSIDEEYSRLRLERVATLPPVFSEEGSITAASAASLNDGAAAVVVMSADRAQDLGAQPIARILSAVDYGVEARQFPIAPVGAIRRALQAAGLQSVSFHEIHEAFAVVPLACMRLLDLDVSRVNVNGGGVALGHPLGASGARIVCTLLSVMQQQDAETGCASIANGGAGATAMILERLR